MTPVLITLLMIALFHGAALLVWLGQSRHRGLPGRVYLAISLFAVWIVVLEQIMVALGIAARWTWVDGATLWAPLLIGPALWLFLRSLTSEVFSHAVYVHFAPAFLSLACLLILTGMTHSQNAPWVATGTELFVAITALAKLLSLLGYLLLSDRRLGREDPALTAEVKQRGRLIIRSFIGGTAFVWAAFLVEHWRARIDSDVIGALLLAGLLYSLSLLVLHYSRFVLPSEARPIRTGSAPPLLDENTVQSLFADLERRVMEDEVFKEAALGLDDLAMLAGLESRYVSYVVNSATGMNVRNWINWLRIREVERILLEQPEANILEIAHSVGFNSKASFYRVFRAQTGQSPNAFRASHFPT